MTSDSEFVFNSSSLPNNSYPVFEDMRRKGILCDVSFKIGECSVSAHRVVLAAGIPYFRDIIYNEAATEIFENEIEMPEISYPALEALIEFVYSCKITITFENVKDLLSAACALNMEEVKQACCEFLKDRLDPESVLDIRHCAHNINCMDLVQITDCYILKNFDEVALSESFLNLTSTFLKELVRKDDLRVSSEEKVFESVMRWAMNAPTERTTDLPELLKNVRFTLLNSQYLWGYVASQELIRKSLPCRDLVDEAKNYHLFPEKREWAFSFPTMPRNSGDAEPKNAASSSDAARCGPSKQTVCKTKKGRKKDIFKIEAKTTCLLQCFDSKENEWYTYANTTIFHENGSTVGLKNKIYLFLKYFTLEFDPKNNDLQLHSGSNRLYTAATVINDCVYVCGGEDSEITNCAQAFDPEMNEWLEVPNMQSRRKSPGAVTLRGCVYVLGGMNRYIFRRVEKFNTEDQIWTLAKPMLTRRYDLGCTTMKDRIYVCGGKGSHGWLNTAEVFNPEINDWEFISVMNKSISKISLVPHFGKLYAVGSFTDEEIPLCTVEVYSPKTDDWSSNQTIDSSINCGSVVILKI